MARSPPAAAGGSARSTARRRLRTPPPRRSDDGAARPDAEPASAAVVTNRLQTRHRSAITGAQTNRIISDPLRVELAAQVRVGLIRFRSRSVMGDKQMSSGRALVARSRDESQRKESRMESLSRRKLLGSAGVAGRHGGDCRGPLRSPAALDRGEVTDPSGPPPEEAVVAYRARRKARRGDGDVRDAARSRYRDQALVKRLMKAAAEERGVGRCLHIAKHPRSARTRSPTTRTPTRS